MIFTERPKPGACKCGGRIAPLKLPEFNGMQRWFMAVECNRCTARQVKEDTDRQESLRLQRIDSTAKKILPYVNTLLTHEGANGSMLEEARRDARNGLYLHGATGTFKTRCLCVLAHEALFTGLSVAWVSSPDLLLRYSAALGGDDGMKDLMKQVAEYKAVDILVIDDWGKGKVTERGRELLYIIVDSRFSSRRPIWYTSNNPPGYVSKWMAGDNNSTASAVLRRIEEASTIINTGA